MKILDLKKPLKRPDFVKVQVMQVNDAHAMKKAFAVVELIASDGTREPRNFLLWEDIEPSDPNFKKDRRHGFAARIAEIESKFGYTNAGQWSDEDIAARVLELLEVPAK